MIPDDLIQLLRKAHKIAILTGAGVSAESGIPTFRDALTGVWENFDPADFATVWGFQQNPKRVWDFYISRRAMLQAVEPNPGHYAIAAMAKYVPALTLATQNIDQLHQRAGFADVIELHGNFAANKCFENNHPVADNEWIEDPEGGVPRCPHCNSILRPDVVWFGEYLPLDNLAKAEQAFREADVVFSIGTSGSVPPAGHLPLVGREHGAWTVEINPEPTDLSTQMDFILRGASGMVLPELVQAVWGQA